MTQPGAGDVGTEEAAQPVVRLRGVSKSFPGVLAVDAVDLDILPGEVHVVAGENGAGKSTLMKLLSQVEKVDAGEVQIDGRVAPFRGPRFAQNLGVSMVHQEFALAPHLSVAENLFLGREPSKLMFVDRAQEVRRTRDLLRRVDLRVEPRRSVSTLSIAEQQLLEIAKALAIDARVVIMDEPTATLTEHEIDELFEVIRELRSRGIAVLYISHRLDEIFRIADRVTVMRDGKIVDTLPVEELDEHKLVLLMVGREISNLYRKPSVNIGDVSLEVEGLSTKRLLRDCSFRVRAGEIVGFAGLVGAGRTETARAVCGIDPSEGGRVEVHGRDVVIRSPRDAIEVGMGYLTEDRKGEGLALQLGVDQNITLSNLPLARGLIDLQAERNTARRRRDQLDIRTPSLRRKVQLLSGGNQQKVVVAKWLEAEAKILFFDEPTRGIDVSAKAEIFQLMGHLVEEGRAIVLISSYMPELINMCDRIVVMREGRVAGELEREEFSEESILALATGAGEGRRE